MDYSVEKMEGFQLIGMERIFNPETSYQEIPRFWDAFTHGQCVPLWNGKKPETPLERAVCECNIGEYGLCIATSAPNGDFRYMIAGRYDGREVPERLTVISLPELEWAKFRCSGPMPQALQAVNTKIFNEWLPGNPDFEMTYGANIEWYSMEGDPSGPDYKSEIWLPVKRK